MTRCAFHDPGEELRGSGPLHETVHHLLLAGLVEGDSELVAVDLDDVAVAELLVEHAVVEAEFRYGTRGFRDQLALDDHRGALVAREAAEIAAAKGIAPRTRKRRLRFVEAAARLRLSLAVAAASAAAAGLGALPA